MPEVNQVAVASIASWEVVANLPTGFHPDRPTPATRRSTSTRRAWRRRWATSRTTTANPGRCWRSIAVSRSAPPAATETTATLRRPGLYDVAFFLDSPRTIHCFEVEVEPNPELAAERARNRPVAVQPVFDGRAVERGEPVALEVGEEVALRFRLVDPATGEPHSDLDDVRVLTYRAPGRDQLRRLAEPMGDGVYQVRFLRQAGTYYAFVASDSAGLRYNESRQLILVAKEEQRAAAAKNVSASGADAGSGDVTRRAEYRVALDHES